MKKRSMQLLTIICTIFGLLQAVNGVEKDTDTIGLWNFNEGKGTVLYDESDNKINFKLYPQAADKKKTSAPKWVSTPAGNGLLFRAEDGRQYHAKAEKLKDQLTFEIWFKPVKNGKRMGLFQAMTYKKKGYRIGLSKNLKIHFSLDGKGHETSVNSKSALKSGAWSHIACTYDGKIAKIYINGKLDNEKDLPEYDLSSVKYSIIGYTGGTPYFNGIVDSIKISNKPLINFSKSLATFKK